MSRFVTLGLVVAAILGTAGCASEDAADAPAGDTPAIDGTATAPAEEQGDSEIDRALANLSPEDRELAVMIGDCPVSDEPLGSMGTPVKITKNGRSLFICCEGCREEAEKNFDDLIAKIDAKKAAAEPESEAAEPPSS